MYSGTFFSLSTYVEVVDKGLVVGGAAGSHRSELLAAIS